MPMVFPLALGRQFYPSREIGPIGSGGHGAGVVEVSAGPGGRRVAGGVERPGAGGGGGPRRRDRAWSPTGPGRTGWGRGAAVGGHGAGGLGSGTGAQLRGAAAARPGAAFDSGFVCPRQRSGGSVGRLAGTGAGSPIGCLKKLINSLRKRIFSGIFQDFS